MKDLDFMARAIELAKKGQLKVQPNPMVGCVIVKNNKIVGLFSCTSHLTDIGGIGTGPDATDVHMEGIFIPMLKLADKGKMNKTLLSMIRQNKQRLFNQQLIN